MYRLKIAAAVGACTLLGSSVAAVTSAAPALAAGCRDTSCTGKNPIDMGCAGDGTIVAWFVDGEGVEAQLKYSAACDAYWAKEQDYGQDPPGWLEVAGRVCSDPEILPVRCHVAVYEQSWDDGFGNNIFTMMIPGDYWARACWSAEGTGPWECTP